MVIVFEGHDGSGKSTLIKHLQKDLELLNKSVIIIKCPSDEKKGNRQLIDDSNSLQNSFEFYLECCIDTSLRIAEYRDIVDYILLDRYYFSTIVSHEARGLSVDRNLFNSLEKVDLKLEIKTNENIRRERVLLKNDMQSHDIKTFNDDLIQKADELYSMLGFIIIKNDHNFEKTLIETKKIIKDYAGKL